MTTCPAPFNLDWTSLCLFAFQPLLLPPIHLNLVSGWQRSLNYCSETAVYKRLKSDKRRMKSIFLHQNRGLPTGLWAQDSLLKWLKKWLNHDFPGTKGKTTQRWLSFVCQREVILEPCLNRFSRASKRTLWVVENVISGSRICGPTAFHNIRIMFLERGLLTASIELDGKLPLRWNVRFFTCCLAQEQPSERMVGGPCIPCCQIIGK